MKCDNIQKLIDEYIFDRNFKLDASASSHIECCEHCMNYFTEAEKQSRLMQEISATEPILTDPSQLTESIMQSVSAQHPNSFFMGKTFKTAYRILTAAVVFLMLTFGVEQFFIINKIQKLEARLNSISYYPPQEYYIQRTSLINIEEILNEVGSGSGLYAKKGWPGFKKFKKTNFTFQQLTRYTDREDAKVQKSNK